MSRHPTKSAPKKPPATRRAEGAALPRGAAITIATVILALGLAHILFLWFVCDDAFISYRYAANLAHGLGPVYNAGERVEGYSNFLWMILSAAIIRLGGEPQTWAPVISAIAALLTLALVLKAAHSRGMNLLPAGVLLAASPGFAAWATSGLETGLFMFALTGGMLALVTAVAPYASGRGDAEALRLSLISGFLFAIATLTRPEALFLSPLAAAYVALAVLRRRVSWRAEAAWIGIWLACVAPMLAWRVSYYRRLLPNSFYVKSPGLPKVADGFGYLLRSFWDLHLFMPLVVAVVALLVAGRARLRAPAVVPIGAGVIIYCAWVTTTGGDFMPLYRFVAPIIPLIALATGMLVISAHAAIAERWSRGAARAVTTLVLIVYVILNVQRSIREQDSWSQGTLASVGLMREQVRDWGELGRELRRVSAPTDSLATTAAGVIPYESRLYTIDLLGLNSSDLSRFRERKGMAGHRWLLSEEWLWRLEPQFLLGHPMVRPADRGVDLSLDLMPEWRARLDTKYAILAFPLSGWPPRRVGCMIRRDIADRVIAAQGKP